MNMEYILYLVLGAAAGGFINGLAGTGTALFALGFYLVALEPVTAVAIVAAMAVLAGIQGLWEVRSDILIQRARVLRFVVPGLCGVPVGLLLLGLVETSVLRLIVAALLIIYGGYFAFRANLPTLTQPKAWVEPTVGLAGGVLGGMAGLSGALPTLWLSLRPWPKAQIRAVLQSFNMVILITTVVLLLFRGAYDAAALKALLITVPTGLIAAQIGLMVFRRLSTDGFRRLLVVMSLLMGLGLLLSEVL